MTTRIAQPIRVVQLLALLLIGLVTPAAAQTGTLAGVVVDAETGETLIGVNVVIAGTATGAATDLDGRFKIPDLQPGTYDLQASYIGYHPTNVTGVEVAAGETTRLELSMTSEAVTVGEVTVEARAVQNTEAALLRERQKASGVSDAISSEAIGRSGSGDAAAAMSKVTGASVVGGKYVYVRGLGERYSNTTLNGGALPSADPDKKAFQLDLIPTGLIDNIVTLKSFTPDKPGDFTGGLVDVATKAFPDAFTLSVSASTTYDSEASFEDSFLSYEGGGTDWLGLDDGTRALPDALAGDAVDIPGQDSQNDFSLTNEERRAAAAERMQELVQSFNGIMTPQQETAPLNRSLSFAVGGPATLFGGQLGYTGSLNYNRSYSAYSDGVFGEWELAGNADELDRLNPTGVFFASDEAEFGGVDYDPSDAALFTNRRGTDEVSWGTSGSVTYRPVAGHEIGTTLLRTQVGTQEVSVLGGVDSQNSLRAFQTQTLRYVERGLWTWQLRGEHYFRPVTLEWSGSLGNSSQDEPDLRFITYAANIAEADGVAVDTSYAFSGAQGQEPTRFFRNLEEDNRSGKADLSVPFRQWSGLNAKLKLGGSYAFQDRVFNQRRFIYREGGLAGVTPVDFRTFDGDLAGYFGQQGTYEEISAGELRAYAFGLYLTERSAPIDNYEADQTIAAGYAMLELPITRKVRLVGGARLETTDIGLVSERAFFENPTATFAGERDDAIDLTANDSLYVGGLNESDLLPSLNLVYALKDNMNLRVAATRTLARPTFRELAPFTSFDFVGGAIFFGNLDLERTLVNNFDARWEWFVRPGEIVAVSAFAKDFTNPIERVIIPNTGGQATFVTVQNVDEARVLGVEFEARKRLDGFGNVPILRHMQVGGNVSLIQSSVDIPGDRDDPNTELGMICLNDANCDDQRPLNGQSSYILNLDAGYENVDTRTSVNLFYNVFGSRLSAVAEGATPDIYEQPRPQLDLTASQGLGASGFALKLSVKNILGSDYEESQTFKDRTYIYRRYTLPRTVSLGVSYGF